MSENNSMLVETAERLFADLTADPTMAFSDLWEKIVAIDLPSLLVPEEAGGFGGDWLDAVAVLRLAGYYALPAPLGEAIIATRLAADSRFPASEGMTSIAAMVDGTMLDDRFSGHLKAVAWGRSATHIVASLNGQVIRLRRADATAIHPSQSPAGDPRDTLEFRDAPLDHAPTAEDMFSQGALIRTALIAGALDAALSRSVSYANERVQFGQPIAKFQAVQQNLAVFAEEAAAVNCAAQAAARAMDRGKAAFEIAAAKYRAGIAADIGHATAHQVHGAIGFTGEYTLHLGTRRLISWASEYGSEVYWALKIGDLVAKAGADSFWTDMTERSD